jgi:hypothetical protein
VVYAHGDKTLTRLDTTFLALVGVQLAHSTEEYLGRLYEVFAPAHFVSTLISREPERGFIIFNLGLLVFGIWCFLGPVRHRWTSAAVFIWVWIAIELVNGIGHPLWSLIERRYTPGVVTAPILLILALYLARQLRSAA